ncbi:MAG: DUF3786 domain-containing protein [Planctomycetes bacterium]|nr:DUF3786 domain-containing protein [Planctomycetota bacterium]MBL7143643.1 DUF3786 domain-containing protein [Phycisphaerae bacterium]
MAHEGLWEQLEKLDGTETAQRAKCQYFDSSVHYTITLLNTEYAVNLSDRNIFSIRSDSTQKEAQFLEQLCILAYLINARDLPLANKLVTGNTLPGGQFFFRGQHSLPTEKLEEAFGDNPEVLHQASAQLNADYCEFGDASISLYMLPRLPLAIVIWGRDEEFEARASILFDQTAASQLPLDALLAAVNLTVGTLLKNASESG